MCWDLIHNPSLKSGRNHLSIRKKRRTNQVLSPNPVTPLGQLLAFPGSWGWEVVKFPFLEIFRPWKTCCELGFWRRNLLISIPAGFFLEFQTGLCWGRSQRSSIPHPSAVSPLWIFPSKGGTTLSFLPLWSPLHLFNGSDLEQVVNWNFHHSKEPRPPPPAAEPGAN